MSIEAMVSQDLPEGWYDDPENPRLQRFWTGSDWTDHVRHSAGTSRPRTPSTFEPTAVATPQFALAEPIAATPAFSFPAPSFDAPTAKRPVFDGPVFAEPLYEAPAVEAPLPKLPVFDAPVAYIGGAAAAAATPGADASAYVPMSHYYMPPSARVSANAKSYSPSTGAVWFLAVSPILWTALQLLVRISAPASAVVSLAISGSILVAMLIAVAVDNVTLRRRSIQPPHFAWFLLGTAPYFAARWWALRGQGIHHTAPGIGFAVSIAASLAVWVLALGALWN